MPASAEKTREDCLAKSVEAAKAEGVSEQWIFSRGWLPKPLYTTPKPAAVGQEPAVWQPIGTAPNGKIVLVHYKNRLGNGRTMRARYYLSETLESDNTESGWADEGWYEESESYEYLMPLEGTPTHWMPLPSAPDAFAHQSARQPPSALPDGDIVFFSDRGDAVTGYSAQRVWEILRAHGIGGNHG